MDALTIWAAGCRRASSPCRFLKSILTAHKHRRLVMPLGAAAQRLSRRVEEETTCFSPEVLRLLCLLRIRCEIFDPEMQILCEGSDLPVRRDKSENQPRCLVSYFCYHMHSYFLQSCQVVFDLAHDIAVLFKEKPPTTCFEPSNS
jgi:hypothetical protein